MSLSSRVCRVVPSEIEAKDFITFYKMKIQKKFNLFPIYCDKLKNNWLVISGTKKLFPSFAAVYLNNCSNSKSNSSWINFGFGYKKGNNVSKILVIDKVTDFFSKKTLYPSTVGLTFLQRGEIFAVNNYKKNNFYFQDFDSYDFYKTTSKFGNKELIAILKIELNEKKFSNKDFKKKSIKNNFDKILRIEKVLKKFSKLESILINYPKYYNEIIKLYYFTTTQKNYLIKLLRKWNNICSYDFLTKIRNPTNSFTSKDILFLLEEDIKKGQLNW